MLQYKDGKLILPEGRVDLVPLCGHLNDAPTSPASAGKCEKEELSESDNEEEDEEGLSESGSEEEEQFSDIFSDRELAKCEPLCFSPERPTCHSHIPYRGWWIR